MRSALPIEPTQTHIVPRRIGATPVLGSSQRERAGWARGKTPRHTRGMRSVAWLLIVGLAVPATQAQWTATNLHPAGATSSMANAVYGFGAGGQQGGVAVVGGQNRASLWKNTSASWTDLHLTNATGSQILSIDEFSQVGAVYGKNGSGGNRAAMWAGSAASYQDLHPTGSPESILRGVSLGKQVGNNGLASFTHATAWAGSGTGAVDLNPLNATSSYALAIYSTQTVGYKIQSSIAHAGSWSGDALSWKDLNPAGWTHSQAWATSGLQQGGFVSNGTGDRACIWAGSPGSMILLHPAGVVQSRVYGVAGGKQSGGGGVQVGRVTMNNAQQHAALWLGSAESFVDLSQFLPPAYAVSEAHGVWSDGVNVAIVGWASKQSFPEAFLWTGTIATTCVPDCDASGDLSIDDFICFQTLFALGNASADCDGSGDLTIDDFICFQTFFAIGC